MGKEIERKFLVISDAWRTENGKKIRQGYLCNGLNGMVRVRTIGERAYLTIKERTRKLSRLEFEYEIPVDEANEILDQLCQKPLIEKTRYEIPYGDFTWEVDEFFGENVGLVVAEVELESENQEFPKPDWLGKDVSDDLRYRNSRLVTHPYSRWKKDN